MLGLLIAGGVLLVGQPVKAQPPTGECVTCQPDGCYANYIGVWDCEATGCGSIFECEEQV